MRNTKIVATFGPACSEQGTLDGLAEAGADLFRLNFSHGGYDELGRAIESIERASEKVGRAIPVLQDLQGVRIRTGRTVPQRMLAAGESLRLVPDGLEAQEDAVGVSYADLAQLVGPGDRILLNDGLMALSVTDVRGSAVHCEVALEGLLGPRQGLNLIGKSPPLALTEKDLEDLRFGVERQVDMVTLPGVRDADDVLRVTKRLRTLDVGTPLLAKLENAAAIANVRDIAEVADGLVFARGDLGVELGALGAQVAQRRVAKVAGALGKPMMMAYPIFESMIDRPRPTSLETAALFHSVSDGYSAVILAPETAVGRYPVEVVREAAAVLEEAERLLGAEVGFHSCFISHSSRDEEFARRLRTDLADRGVQCWFAPEDMKIGDKIRERIHRSIMSYDRLLLILSEASVTSKWVATEVEAALAKETAEGPVLFPVRLDDAVMDTDTAWAAEVRQTRHIGDFRRWKEHDEYQRSLTRLLRDLDNSVL